MADTSQDPHYTYFRSIPWCSYLFDDPSFHIRHYENRDPKPDTEDSFTAETLKTPLAIHAALVFAALPTGPSPLPIREVRILFALGSGLNGHAHVAHGGFLVTLFDEVQAILLSSNKDLQPKGVKRPASSTASMKVDYLAPVKTPQVVLARAWLKEASGRKYYIDSTVEDGAGRVLAKGSGLWISSTAIQVPSRL